MRLSDFSVLTFDCYGTLIDWEGGIVAALEPLLGRAATPIAREDVLERFARHESAQEAETPRLRYAELLARVHRALAEELGLPRSDEDDRRFGASVPDWPAFADSAESLAYLKRHFKLAILSNVDRASFRGSNERLGVAFDAVYTAEDVGSYKPDPANFAYMLDRLGQIGVRRGDILHTAQSLFHDHAPARRAGLASAWIDRRHGRTGWGATLPPPQDSGFDFRFESMAELVSAHRREAS